MPVRTVASQSFFFFFRGIMFRMRRMVLFMHFFHSMDPNRSDNPGKHTVHDTILDKVIETGKGQKVKAK